MGRAGARRTHGAGLLAGPHLGAHGGAHHRPYFTFSREVNVVVSGSRNDPPVAIDRQNMDASCQAWYDNEVTRLRGDGPAVRIGNSRDKELVSSPFRVNFDVRGLGVAPKGYADAKHGHFVLRA